VARAKALGEVVACTNLNVAAVAERERVDIVRAEVGKVVRAVLSRDRAVAARLVLALALGGRRLALVAVLDGVVLDLALGERVLVAAEGDERDRARAVVGDREAVLGVVDCNVLARSL